MRREVRPGSASDRDRLRSLHGPTARWRPSNYREEFGFNFDPSHLIWQGVDPVEFIRAFSDRIYHVHMKDADRDAQRAAAACWGAT